MTSSAGAARGLWTWRFALLVGAAAALATMLLRTLLPPATFNIPGTDAVLLFTWEQYTRAALAQHQLPFWNPYQFGGVPFLADTQTTVLYPPALLLRWVPAPAYLSWMAALHLSIAAAGAIALARTIGLSWLAAGAAAAGAMFGGSVAPWIYHGHLLLLYLAAWLPWALAAAIWSARRASVWPHPLLPVVLALQFLAGYLQGSIYLAVVVGAYAIYSVAWPDVDAEAGARRWHPLAQLAIAGSLALALTAFELLPLIRLVREAGRTAGIPFSDAIHEGWRWGDLATIFFPFRGLPAADGYHDMGDRAYVGWLLALLVPFAFADRERRRVIIFFSLLTIAALGLALGADLPLYRVHYWLFPGLREPGRVLFVATVCLALMGAAGLDRFAALVRMRDWTLFAAAGLISVTALAVSFAFAGDGGVSAGRTLLHFDSLALVVGAALAVAILLAGINRPAWGRAILAVIVAADMYAFVAHAVHPVSMEERQTIREWLGPPTPDRMWSRCENRIDRPELMLHLQPALSGAGGVFLRGYDEWSSLLGTPDRATSSEPPALGGRRDLLDQAAVTRVVSCADLDAPHLSLSSHVPPVLVYRNDTAWPRATWFCGAEPMPHDAVAATLLQARYDDRRRLVRPHVINVRWAPAVTDADRAALEARFGLLEGGRERDRTWHYALEDTSTANLVSLIQNPAVEDTQGIDRGTGALLDPPGAVRSTGSPDVVVGTIACDVQGVTKMRQVNTPDGRAVADVTAPRDGVVFFSEPYYSERQAFVDGRRTDALRANLGFTAVRVPAGAHRVELRYVPTAFYAGSGISAAALLLWPVATWMTRRRTMSTTEAVKTTSGNP